MKIKLFTIGDNRPPRHFISDNTICICEVRAIGTHSSAKDFEICLVYKIDTDKTLTNNFHSFRDHPGHVIERDINMILSRDTVSNFHICPYTTQHMRGYIFFWEESIAKIGGIHASTPSSITG